MPSRMDAVAMRDATENEMRRLRRKTEWKRAGSVCAVEAVFVIGAPSPRSETGNSSGSPATSE